MKTIHILLVLLIIGCSIGVVTADPEVNNTGTVRISSNPSGSKVYLDSVYKGDTPEIGSYLSIPNLAPGTHTLTLTKTGYMDLITTVAVVVNETVSVSVNLTPASGIPTSTIIIGVLVVIVIILVAAFILIRRKKPEKVEKIELD